MFRFLRIGLRSVALKNFLKKQGGQQRGNHRHKDDRPPLFYAERGGLNCQQHHHNGAGQVGDGELKGRAEQPAHAVVEPPQQGEKPAQYPAGSVRAK